MSDLKFSLPTHRTPEQRGERRNASSPSLSGAATSVVVAKPIPTPAQAPRRRHVTLVLAVLLFCSASYFLVSRFVVTAVVVEGRSMYPTLQHGDRCLLDRWTLNRRSPRRGELVVIRDPGHDDYAVKRVVALPGEAIHLKDGVVYLNGEKLDEPYLMEDCQTVNPGSNDQYVLLGSGQYFVLGDNREQSEDSRFYGPLQRRNIVGLITLSN